MKRINEYQRYADICRKLSLDTSDPLSKRQLMEMSTVWTLLAIEREDELAPGEQPGHPGLPGTGAGAEPGTK